MAGEFDAIRETREAIWARGFRPIAIETAKQGDKLSGKRPLGAKWQINARKDPPEVIEYKTVVPYALNTGILCDGLRAIDFDIDDKDMVDRATSVAVTMFGPTMLRTRNNSPRCMMVYRAAEGEPVKVAITGETHSDTVSCKIEVLGKGQQLVAYGKHWTGADLEWPTTEGGPDNRKRVTIPAVTEAQIGAFLAACVGIIGARPIPVKPPRKKANGKDDAPTADQGDLFAALNVIANDGPPDWEAWNKIGMALWAATEGSDAGWELWSAWSAKHPAADDDMIKERWANYAKSPPTETGAGKIFALAVGNSPGWRKPSTLRGNGHAQEPYPLPIPNIPPPPIPQDAPAEDEPEDEGDEPPEEWDAEAGPAGPESPTPQPGPPGPEPPPIEEVMQGEGLITEQYAARLFTDGNKDKLRFNHSSNMWMLWDKHCWRPDERKLAFYWSMDLCRALAATIQGRRAREGRMVVEKIRFSGAVETGARVMPELATAQNDWDANLMLLGTPGGVVDLKTAEMRQGLRKDMISRTTAVTPSEQPDCPRFMAFLRYAMHENEELVKFIQRYLGYCLTGRVNEEIFLFLFGVAGAGKGTLIETVVHIMGDYAGAVPMEVFTGQSWSPTEYYRANMAGKRMIVANEPERDAYWAEAFIKETTGGDTLSGRHPMGRPFRFKPTHKLALVGNHMPKLRGRSTGMERRLRILPFNRKPETADTGLKAALLAEAPGILRWMIEGCIAWQKIGMCPPDAVKIAGNEYFEAQDAFARWIDELCDLDTTFKTSPSSLRTSFNQWAKVNGEDEMTGNAFSEAIDQYEPPPGNKPLRRDRSDGKRWVVGITIKPQKSKENQKSDEPPDWPPPPAGYGWTR